MIYALCIGAGAAIEFALSVDIMLLTKRRRRQYLSDRGLQ